MSEAALRPARPGRRGTLRWLGALGSLAAVGAAPALVRAAPRTLLTVAAFPAVDDIVRAAVPAWQQRHPDVDIKVVSRQFADHHTAMTTALSTSSFLPDVMALEVGYVGRFARGSGLDDLNQPPYEIARVRSRYVPYAFDQATRADGAVVAAPTDIGPGTLLYRTDLLARSGVVEAELTRSWESYVAAGVAIKAATGAYLLAHARDMKDILIRTDVQPGQGLYFDKESRVLVTSQRFVRAFELARTVRQKRLDAKVSAWSNEWSEGFKRGALATQMSGAWLAGHLSNWLAPDTRGKWRAAQLPEGAFAAYGGTFLALPRRAPAANKALSWELIQLLTLNREMQLAAFKAQDAFPAAVDTFDDPFFEQPIPFLGGQAARVLWREATRRITAVAVHRQDAFASEVIDTELDKVLDRGKDIGEALADAEKLLALRAHR
jgi:multiple sugar transport system substrate-binding protein